MICGIRVPLADPNRAFSFELTMIYFYKNGYQKEILYADIRTNSLLS